MLMLVDSAPAYRVLNYVNRYQSKSALPSSLTEETTAALTHLVRMNCCRSMISQSTVEILIHETVSALLNPSLICVPGMMVSMNKVCPWFVYFYYYYHSLLMHICKSNSRIYIYIFHAYAAACHACCSITISYHVPNGFDKHATRSNIFFPGYHFYNKERIL